MTKAALSPAEVLEMFVRVCDRMIESKDALTEADKAIGDGDHGIGMARGFAAVRDKLRSQNPSDIAGILQTAGTALVSSVGGASGVIFGSLFLGASKAVGPAPEFDSAVLAKMLAGGLQSVAERGKAKPGDKTVVDALEPAARKATELEGVPLAESLAAVFDAAAAGVENTKTMVATIGKAKTLGERSLGYCDPGALSFSLILAAIRDFAAHQE